MSDKCPNCGSGDWIEYEYQKTWCEDCGTRWSPDGDTVMTVHVPTRSRPAEVKELPDVDDYWWYRKRPTDDWITGRFGPSSNRGLGQYVRAVPPIIAPAKPDPDAELIRKMYRLLTQERIQVPLEVVDNLDQFGRIAADLERLKREAKEAGR